MSRHLQETGEMDHVDPEEWPCHVAMADAVGGVLEPFDEYQGPYVAFSGEQREGTTPYSVPVQGKGIIRLWLTDEGVYREDTREIFPCAMDPESCAEAAREAVQGLWSGGHTEKECSMESYDQEGVEAACEQCGCGSDFYTLMSDRDGRTCCYECLRNMVDAGEARWDDWREVAGPSQDGEPELDDSVGVDDDPSSFPPTDPGFRDSNDPRWDEGNRSDDVFESVSELDTIQAIADATPFDNDMRFMNDQEARHMKMPTDWHVPLRGNILAEDDDIKGSAEHWDDCCKPEKTKTPERDYGGGNEFYQQKPDEEFEDLSDRAPMSGSGDGPGATRKGRMDPGDGASHSLQASRPTAPHGHTEIKDGLPKEKSAPGKTTEMGELGENVVPLPYSAISEAISDDEEYDGHFCMHAIGTDKPRVCPRCRADSVAQFRTPPEFRRAPKADGTEKEACKP